MADNQVSLEISDSELNQMTQSSSWDELVAKTNDFVGRNDVRPSVLFFRGNALLNLSRDGDALEVVQLGLALAPSNSWGKVLEFKAMLSLGQIEEAFLGLQEYVENESGENKEVAKTIFVDEAVKLRKYALAEAVNDTRKVIKEDKLRPKYAVAIQCFNKSDTLAGLFETLVKCDDTALYGLVILQDSAEQSKKPEQYAVEVDQVRRVIAEWLPRLSACFGFVELITNPANKGTAPSCRRLLDFVCQNYEGFLFLEDDCLVSQDALSWANYHLEHNVSRYGYWFATCESVFFNSRNSELTSSVREKAVRFAARQDVSASYIDLDFVPSTCFITTKEIWTHVSGVRSFSRGPESLSQYLGEMNVKTLAPVVPRAYDIGMLHESGYSVAMLGKENVKELKSVYLTSEGPLNESKVLRFAGDKDAVYAATVNLDEECFEKL